MASEPVGSSKGFGDPRYRTLIDALVAARKEQSLSQQALASRLGRPQQFVSRYELGERRLDVVEYVDIARKLGLADADIVAVIAQRA